MKSSNPSKPPNNKLNISEYADSSPLTKYQRSPLRFRVTSTNYSPRASTLMRQEMMYSTHQ
jgi:hypothetical protein